MFKYNGGKHVMRRKVWPALSATCRAGGGTARQSMLKTVRSIDHTNPVRAHHALKHAQDIEGGRCKCLNGTAGVACARPQTAPPQDLQGPRDSKFTEKPGDVVGLHLNLPEQSLLLCCDEKSQMQALDRTQPGLPLKKGRVAGVSDLIRAVE